MGLSDAVVWAEAQLWGDRHLIWRGGVLEKCKLSTVFVLSLVQAGPA